MSIIQMLVPDQYVFPNFWGGVPRWLILHKTAGFHTAQEVAAYFQSGSNGLEVSSHYVVGLDGTIVQCVRETDGAGANGVIEAGADPWWSGNPNLVTYSFEHVDPSPDNSTPLTDAQKSASFWLVRDLCTRRGIPMRPADANGGITGHFSIDPQSRHNCPGNYPWNELWAYLKGQTTMIIPAGWHDDGTKLVAPNGHFFVKGFRQAALDAFANGENPDWWIPQSEEVQVTQVELHTNSGPGAQQCIAKGMLIWTPVLGVRMSAAGLEIFKAQQVIASLQAQLAGNTALQQAQAQISTLQHKISTAQEALK